ncbi:tyrosine-type recombinase/integrase, partial [Streptosporangium canum]|uniref:tyrosine-type recombinase/integrase n=1 Tax=Streptosporangium canum TaxID=324952 RepID=UPI00341F1D66
MANVHRLHPASDAPALGVAVVAFLETIAVANTANAYAIALRALTAALGEQTPLAELEGEAGADRVAGWFTGRWGGSAAATFNARLDALGSACAWWRDQHWLTGDPLRRIRRRARTPDRTRALSRAEVEQLLTLPRLALRERTLFRLLYESAARTQEALALDVADLDLRNRRAWVRRKGGAVDVIVWRTATARLLPRLLDSRRTGPVFLTGRRARVELPPGDLDPASGQARLSYRRAAELFEAATADLPG